jgi:hypothetical protein
MNLEKIWMDKFGIKVDLKKNIEYYILQWANDQKYVRFFVNSTLWSNESEFTSAKKVT